MLVNRLTFLEHLFFYYNADLLELPSPDDVVVWLRQRHLGEDTFNNCGMSMRWAIYFHIASQARKMTAEVAAESGKKLIELQKKLQELQRFGEGYILKNSKVVGMTTTGAAKYNDLVRMMGSKIVVVEEAAEVLESHIVTCITKHCEHLILIGDHRQLRPSTTVYDLAKKFKLDISLFERMIKNDLNCYQLTTQHRMRPEIADLVVGTVYETLHNDHSVTLYPPVDGVTKNLFFLSHKEMESSDEDSTSKTNLFEADFLGALCRHLILQGYETDQITILTAYMGQMFLLKKTLSGIPNCKGVRVTCVDNFQGEENDIILLSLVRSNEDEKLGFLNVDNRVCVSLSRAKHGLFIVGNMEMLSSKSKIWSQIKEKLQVRDEIGESITLECQIHGTESTVASESDFRLKAPQGGCAQCCDVPLPCGHNCRNLCHVKDREHLEYECKLPCPKYCENNLHPCEAECFKNCPPCLTKVTRTLPQCSHEATMDCRIDPSTYKCQVQVVKILPCGHVEEMACFKDPEEFTCKVQVLKTLQCGHQRMLECHEDVLLETCKVLVEKELPCGHTQNAECRFLPEAITCKTVVPKCLTDCGHTMEVACGDQDNKAIKCTNSCSIRLPCGHACTKKCHTDEDPDHHHYTCRKECTKVCEGSLHDEDPLLEHKCKVTHPCFETCPPCKVKILRKLPCGHSKCLECFVDITKHECRERCERVMDCTHPCKNQCFQKCGPCKVVVEKTVPFCGHTIKTQCSTDPEHKLCEKAVMPTTPSPCGHSSLIPCRLSVSVTKKEQLEMCKEPCKELFQEETGFCGHFCKGTCRTCWQGRFHEKCKEPCGKTLVCGHICAFPCAKFCPPCDKACPMRCEHSKCYQKCGTPCNDCNERCTWKCSHLRCTKLCKEECDRPPCNEPCPKTLKCGHPCIGFCGESCPVHCRVCDKKELTELILSGNEEEEDARFIHLPDCKHSIEVEALTYHMNLEDGEIGMKKCPRCQTVITRCRRFNNVIRKRLKDVCVVKKKVFGNDANVKSVQNEIMAKLDSDPEQNAAWKQNFGGFYEFLISKVAERVAKKKGKGKKVLKNKQVDFGTISSIRFLLEHGKAAVRILTDSKRANDLTEDLQKRLHDKYQGLFSKIMTTHPLPLSPIEVRDISNEMERLYDVHQVYLRGSKPQFINGMEPRAVPIYEELLLIVEAPCPYTDAEKKETLRARLLDLDELLRTGLGISNAEKIEILNAFDMRQGHWFKCPNGHIYVITECGGAMEESTCNECKAKIGGANHALRSDNALASEMDGATAPLWPNTLQNEGRRLR